MLKVKQMTFSMFGVNTYVLVDQATRQAAVIDPAMSDEYEQKQFDDYLVQEHATLTQVINTHLHLDHCFGMDYVKTKYGVPAKANVGDADLGLHMDEQYAKFGMSGAKSVVIDVPLEDGDIISVGDSQLRVIHVPGHSSGGIALYYQEGGLLFSGDSLFRRSVGRTDLLGGDHEQLIDSIASKLYPLPGNTVVLPGHNGPTTIDEEKKFNPFTR